MDNEQDTTNEAESDEVAGLLDRFDELFDEGGVPKEGTEQALSGDDPVAEVETEEVAEEPAEEPSDDVADESTEDAESEEVEESTSEQDDSAEVDDFDKHITRAIIIDDICIVNGIVT